MFYKDAFYFFFQAVGKTATGGFMAKIIYRD